LAERPFTSGGRPRKSEGVSQKEKNSDRWKGQGFVRCRRPGGRGERKAEEDGFWHADERWGGRKSTRTEQSTYIAGLRGLMKLGKEEGNAERERSQVHRKIAREIYAKKMIPKRRAKAENECGEINVRVRGLEVSSK